MGAGAIIGFMRHQNSFWISAVAMDPKAVISAAQTGAEILIRRMARLPPVQKASHPCGDMGLYSYT
jgi:hypothetical protein